MQAFQAFCNPLLTPKWVKGGYTIAIRLCKRTKVKSLTWRTLGFSEYGLTNSSTLRLALPLTATQKGVIKGGNTIDMYLCKKKLNQCHIVPSGSRVRNDQWTQSLGLPLSVLQKGVKGVTKVTFVYVKRVRANTGVTSHLYFPGVRNNQCKQL